MGAHIGAAWKQRENIKTKSNWLSVPEIALLSIDCGFSRQKMAYTRGAAQAIVDGQLPLDRLGRMDDDTAMKTLTRLRGVGPWTAEVYLLMALGRADIWPAGDLALQRAVQSLRGLPDLPDTPVMHELAAPWRPLRAVAARILWHGYLSERA